MGGVMKLSSVSVSSAKTLLLPLHPKSKPIKLMPSSPDSFPCTTHKFKLLRHFTAVACSKPSVVVPETVSAKPETDVYIEQEGSPIMGQSKFGFPKLSPTDLAFSFLLFIAVTTTASLVGLLAAAIPTMGAMRRVAISLAKLANTAREEIPSTMAAVRLTCLEISDLTDELKDLSEEITDGVSKSTQAVKAANAGIRQIGSLAQEQTMSMIEERANLPVISLQPFVAGAAQKTSSAVGRATRTFMNIISKHEPGSDNEDASNLDGLEA